METAVQFVLEPRELLNYIELLRKQLINMGLTHGFQDHRTIQASQELDYFIYEYQRITA
ncbi:aspartyl-phosphate phosphatase Spo0E family protein [Mesobacillus maritimus]|uniref:aspartyl-phosphate phosphatase Spo0E family protein n=1 Tax=Mesobacillus maritimus TaxID=1643336 RepID=UPI0020421D43|nr:aspartyl-phosphate phosphatase Spo0E family protein [Mesobacillus maritimus]MCM3588900.1 aspartyl-phosphate phosphatase Spo0E family protein [Mesobacillus maritimus]MCM3672099.1 aspartyl-phosphate phosphatase Spo0E family protein [Mesobacillus maritimus]